MNLFRGGIYQGHNSSSTVKGDTPIEDRTEIGIPNFIKEINPVHPGIPAMGFFRISLDNYLCGGRHTPRHGVQEGMSI